MRELAKARALCASDRIRVFYLTRRGPVEERDPEKRLACLFTASLPLADYVEPAIDFKKPLEIRPEDFQPILARLQAGTKLGIQIGNPSVRIGRALHEYREKYERAKEKSKKKQQLSEDETKIVAAFEGAASGIFKLDVALYYSRVLNFMANIGLMLAVQAGKMDLPVMVTICPDDVLSSEEVKKGLNQEEVTYRAQAYHLMRLRYWAALIQEEYGISFDVDVYPESKLLAVHSADDAACACDFCIGRICPARVSSAVEKLIDRGCGAVVNFYIENEGSSQKSYMHFERIERGMLHRTTELGDETLRANVYFGVKRAFMTIHESPTG